MPINPYSVYDRLYGPVRRAAPRTWQSGAPMYSEEKEKSVLRDAVNATLSGIGAVGSFLDVPGSMVRDVAVGQNPFDQLATPLSNENRATGRDVLEKWGALRPNRPGFDWGDVGGFAAEVFTDPLTYLTLGSGAATKAGRAAQMAGIWDDAVKVATSRLPKAAVRGGKRAGPMQARMTVTPEDIFEHLPGSRRLAAKKHFAETAKKWGVPYKDLINQRLGGAFGVGMPLFGSRNLFTVGKAGGKTEAIASALDAAGQAVRYAPGVRHAFGVLGRASGRMTSKMGQYMGKDITEAVDVASNAAREQLTGAIRFFDESGFLDPRRIMEDPQTAATTLEEATKEATERGQNITRYLEKAWYGGQGRAEQEAMREVASKLPVELRRHLNGMTKALDKMYKAEEWAGFKVKKLEDMWAEYFPRERVRFPDDKKGFAIARLFDTVIPEYYRRAEHLREFPGGTALLNEISMDPRISGLAAKRVDGKLWEEDVDRIIKILEQDYNITESRMQLGRDAFKPEKFQRLEEVDFGGVKKKIKVTREAVGESRHQNLVKRLAEWVGNLNPKHAELHIPAYEVNPLKPLLKRLEHGNRAVRTLEGMVDNLSSFALNIDEYPTVHSGKNFHRVNTLIDEFSNLDAKRVKRRVFNAMYRKETGLFDVEVDLGNNVLTTMRASGADPSDFSEELVDQALSKMYIPMELAKDMRKVLGTFSSPEATNVFLRMYDAHTRLFKSAVTATWPAFHLRNRFSGMVQNFLGRAWSLKDEKQALQIIGGKKSIEGLAKELPGFKGADEDAVRWIVDTAWTTGTVGHKQGYAVEAATDVLEGPVTGIPGVGGFMGHFPAKVPGATLRQRMNPLSMTRENVFGPERWGRGISNWVENQNRLVPYMNLLKKGYTPREAARRVKLLQVDYTARAELDPWMRRMFPFWTFTRGMAVQVADSLMREPGGRLAQSIRAANYMRDPEAIAPDYVAERLSIPLKDLPSGSRRYLAGAGLMHEDPLNIIGSPLSELGGKLNPALKVPLELMADKSMFFRQPISELDPPIGRSIQSIRELARDPSKFIWGGSTEYVPGDEVRIMPPTASHILQNSPLSRYISSFRTMVDPRKGLGAKFANLMTGFKLYDVSPGKQDYLLDQRLREMQKERGARDFEKVYFDKEYKEEVRRENPELYEMIITLEAMRSRLERNKHRRALARQAL